MTQAGKSYISSQRTLHQLIDAEHSSPRTHPGLDSCACHNDEASPFALLSTRNHLRTGMHQGCVSSHRRRGGSSDCRRQRAASVADRTQNRSSWSPLTVFIRPPLVICWQIAGKRRSGAFGARNRPGAGPGLSCWFGVEPPAGIEPATPSFTMDPPGTAVQNTISPGHARP